MEYDKRDDGEGLALNVEICKFDAETNCILVSRVAGNSIDFMNEYKRIREYVFDEL